MFRNPKEDPFHGNDTARQKAIELLLPFKRYEFTENEWRAALAGFLKAARMLVDGDVWPDPLGDPERTIAKEALEALAEEGEFGPMLIQHRVIRGGDSNAFIHETVGMRIINHAGNYYPDHPFFRQFRDE